jgi:hypothetical protein
LKAELAQVESEIAAGPSNTTERASTKRRSILPPKPAYDLAGELSGLKERLAVAEGSGSGKEIVREEEDEWSQRLERLKIGESSTSSTAEGISEAEDGAAKMETGTSYPISDLDQRLARLEAALGPDESSVSLSLPS